MTIEILTPIYPNLLPMRPLPLGIKKWATM
ncbi:Uncharacterised protein [Mannheimia haemolytica]|uniref:Uncharacterized protein n=1 Tax=Mannheimia haemolytica TaxID=75985 RepID=A0A378N644_MANHA|nr:Uncharacterised protein [Mannheimia haemolytica]